MSLAGKVILITGASQGIGKACAERVAKDGASVVINYKSSTDAANALVESIGSDRALAVQADASTIEGVQTLVDAAVAKFGKIDTVLANAGVLPMRGVDNTTEADFDETFAMNVKGPYFLVQKAVPHMPRGSRVILVSSTVCHFSAVAPAYLLYAATKGAIEQMTRVMSKGLAANGITVNCVAPGPTATELFFKGKPEAMINGIKAANPNNRLGEPDEIASVIKFLCSEDSSWVTGQTMLVNGGMAV
ncbi:hypothetical protein B0I35DRAFT_452403 [Stachybotrys elegans]|uniref:Ketoreductase domain-containing protein n=1 Tax=Stachybotrys elegans TaxID=80388 RepID=A0A8K0SMN2_9HYPO|nr:hypothetical protein B0I35DRAFT_452403 [Stachybotrys elegans]